MSVDGMVGDGRLRRHDLGGVGDRGHAGRIVTTVQDAIDTASEAGADYWRLQALWIFDKGMGFYRHSSVETCRQNVNISQKLYFLDLYYGDIRKRDSRGHYESPHCR
jgi:hypothetical protein